MRNLIGNFTLIIALFASAVSVADDVLVPPDRFVFCTVCHGAQLQGNLVIAAPRLSGMEDWYVERQLQAFRNGWRGRHERDFNGMEMRPMAEILVSEDVAAVSHYVNSVESEPAARTISGDATAGERLYATCAACHGANGEGNAAVAGPALTHTNDWYLVTQLTNFRDGVRGGADGDDYGAQMRAAAASLQDSDILNIVEYINSMHTQ